MRSLTQTPTATLTATPARTLAGAALALCLALPAVAQEAGTPMGAAEFDAYTRGRTLSYAFEGTPYGIEEYLPNRRVRWSFIGNTCQEGVWYERAGNICFLYENAPDNEQCWHFFETENGMHGVFQGPDGPGTELYEVHQSDRPLNCAGPEVGV